MVGQVKEIFPTFVPRAIASISALEATLEDRAIMLMLQRKPPGEQTERFSTRHLEREAQQLRDTCYLFALTAAASISRLYEHGDFAGLKGLDDRALNLWEPLIAIAAVADAAGDTSTFTTRLTALAQQLGTERVSRAGDDLVPGILDVLNDLLCDLTEVKVTTTELLEKVKERFGWETLSGKGLSNRLHPLGFHTVKWREGNKTVRGYVLKATVLRDLERRYVPEEAPQVPQVPQSL